MKGSVRGCILAFACFVVLAGLAATTYSFATTLTTTSTTTTTKSIHPLYIQGHSPIDILVTDPNGHQVGCQAEPCSGNTPGTGNVVNTIGTCPPSPPTAECADFSGAGTTPENVTITNPIPGNYNVEVFSTGSGSYTLTACITGSPNCRQTITLCNQCSTSSSPQFFAFAISSSGQISQITTGVPQFPYFGMLSITAVGIVLFVIMRRAFVPRGNFTNPKY